LYTLQGNGVHVIAFIWQLIALFDPTARGKTMEVWVEEQQARLEDPLPSLHPVSVALDAESEFTLSAAIESDLGRVNQEFTERQDEIRRISATGTTRRLNAEHQANNDTPC